MRRNYDQFLRGRAYETKDFAVGVRIEFRRRKPRKGWAMYCETKREMEFLDRAMHNIDRAMCHALLGERMK